MVLNPGKKMPELLTIFDLALVLTLLVVAWQVLFTRALFKGIVLFIAFGLLVSLAWVRLAAPDIALAEAAIGSGITGALLLSALGRMRRMERRWIEEEDPSTSAPPRTHSPVNPTAPVKMYRYRRYWGWFPLKLFALFLAFILGWAVLSLPHVPGLAGEVMEHLPQSGVTNPVTAVLLNLRGYDTLLEVSVLLLAVVGVWAFSKTMTGRFYNPHSDVLMALVRFNLPIMVIAAGYLLWAGADRPGGAFQAGAVLGGAGVLWLLSEARRPFTQWIWALRLGVSIGLLVFIFIGVFVMFGEGHFLEYPPGWAKTLILIIEGAAMISIGLILASMFLGGRPGTAVDPLPTDAEYIDED
jgi:multisubunit Na+/H+ antiporter MnhB subunit